MVPEASADARHLAALVLKDETAHAASRDPVERAGVGRWLDDRNEEPGGFLWAAGILGVQPGVIEHRLRALLVPQAGAARKAARAALAKERRR